MLRSETDFVQPTQQHNAAIYTPPKIEGTPAVLFLSGPEWDLAAAVLRGKGWHQIDVKDKAHLAWLASETLPDPLLLTHESGQRTPALGNMVRDLFGGTCWYCVAEGAPATIVLGAGFEEAHESIKGSLRTGLATPSGKMWGAQTWERCVDKALGLWKPDPAHRVEVCDQCLRASCWWGRFPCPAAKQAGTLKLPVWALGVLRQEHPDYWEPQGVTPA